MTHPKLLKLLGLAEEAKRILEPHADKRCCVFGTRVGLEVLRRWNIPARPQLVAVRVVNERFLRSEQGAAELRCGWEVSEVTHDGLGLDGHLVIIAKVGLEEYLVDLTAFQFERQDYEIGVHAGLVLRIENGHVDGRKTYAVARQTMTGAVIQYGEHLHDDETAEWRKTTDWLLTTPEHSKAYRACLSAMLAIRA